MKSYIPDDILDQLRTKLISEKGRILKLKRTLDTDSPIHDTDRLDDNAASDADAAEENRMITSQVMTAETEQTLKKIEGALKRMEEGTYGLTDDGKEIPVERLMVDPTATTLVNA